MILSFGLFYQFISQDLGASTQNNVFFVLPLHMGTSTGAVAA